MKTQMEMPLIYAGAIENHSRPSAHEDARGQVKAGTGVASEDLARFEGEGGMGAPDLVVPHHEERAAPESKNIRLVLQTLASAKSRT